MRQHICIERHRAYSIWLFEIIILFFCFAGIYRFPCPFIFSFFRWAFLFSLLLSAFLFLGKEKRKKMESCISDSPICLLLYKYIVVLVIVVSAALKMPKNSAAAWKTDIDNQLATRGKTPALSTLSTAQMFPHSVNSISTGFINDLQIVFRLGCAWNGIKKRGLCRSTFCQHNINWGCQCFGSLMMHKIYPLCHKVAWICLKVKYLNYFVKYTWHKSG